MVKSAPSSTLPDITSISRRRSSLSEERKQVLSGKRSEFRRSRDILSREENVFEMSDEKVEVEEGSLSSSADHQMHVESEIQKLRREVEQLRQLKSISEFEGRSRSPKKDSQRHRRTYPMLPDPNTLLDESKRRRKTSEPILHRSPSISKAKTLCFQISFNGVPLMEKTEFEED